MIRIGFIILCFVASENLYSQNTEVRIVEIDSLISLIPEETHSSEYYSNLDASGVIQKKILKIFKKRIGSVTHYTVFHDTLIFEISNYYWYEKDDQMIVENYYYDDNELIRYNEISRIQISDSLKTDTLRQIDLYFDQQKIISKNIVIKDEFGLADSLQTKIIRKSKAELVDDLDYLKLQRNE